MPASILSATRSAWSGSVGEDVGAEAVRRVVGELDRLVLGADLVDLRDRAEELLVVGGVVGVMSVRTAVLKKLPSRPPPATSVAPLSSARLTCSSSRSAASAEDSGPIVVSDDVGSPGSTAVSAAVNFSRNGS